MHRSAFALNSSVPQSLGSTCPVGDLADQVGLRPRRGRLAAVGAEARAHPHGRLEAAALAAAVAGRGHRQRARAGPAEDRQDGRGGSDRARPARPAAGSRRPPGLSSGVGGLRDPDEPGAGPRVQPRERGEVRGGGRGKGRERLQVVCRQVGIVADDLAGIEQVRRVEGVLDLAEDLDELAVLPGQELGAGQAAALRRGDRPPRARGRRRRPRLASGSSLARSPGSARSRKGRRRIRPSPA